MTRISTYMISQRALTAMLSQQGKLSDTQRQLSTGQRILNPSDDPAGAARVLNLNRAISTVQQYQTNAKQAQGRLEAEESVLSGVTNVLQRSRDLAIQGNNGTLSGVDKKALALEVRQLLDQTLSMANSKNSSGEYIFSGYQTDTQPFSLQASGNYHYAGDLGQRQLQISSDRFIADGDTGFDVFVDVKTAKMASVQSLAASDLAAINDGDFTVDGGNRIGPVSIGAIPMATDVAERSRQLRDAINRVSEDTGVRAVSDGGTLTLSTLEGERITVEQAAGVDARTGLASGTTVAKEAKRNIFDTLNNMAADLEKDLRVDRYIEDLRLAMDNILETRSRVGSQLNTIDQQKEVNADLELSLASSKSEEQDLDYAEALSRFERQKLALEAAQQSYVKIKSLSLFDYM
ncbi:MAG: flagellar hook-associated protein 3 [Gammaproteobacteria bacterium]|nr:flagellar hook-associated protein 3 [Gammaproteobacteria bacterium]